MKRQLCSHVQFLLLYSRLWHPHWIQKAFINSQGPTGLPVRSLCFVSFFINLAGRHIQKWDGPRLLRSQRLPLIARKSGKLNAVRWDPSERGLLRNVSPWLKHYDFKVRQIIGNLKGIRVEPWGNWATVTKLTELHLQVSTRKAICMHWINTWVKSGRMPNLSEIALLTSLLLPMEVCFLIQLVSLYKIQFSVYVTLCVRVSHYI